MDIESYREYCLAKRAATEELPFGPTTLVFKVQGKIFAIVPLDVVAFSINLKCDPERAIELRDQYDAIRAGFHMNKKHWNTLYCDEGLDDKLIRELTDHSYELVVKGLTKADRALYNNVL